MNPTDKKIKIRAAKMEEAQKIRDLENAVWGEDVVNQYDIPIFVRFGYCFVAESAEKIVGAIIALVTKQSDVYVLDLVVDKNYRRLGIAEKLKRRLMRAVPGKDILSLVRDYNSASLALNAKIGIISKKAMMHPFGLNEGKSFLVRIKAR